MTTGTDLPDFVTYKIYTTDKVNSILSATLQHLDSEQIISLRDSLIERTPPKHSPLPDEARTIPEEVKQKIADLANEKCSYPSLVDGILKRDYKMHIGFLKGGMEGYSLASEEISRLKAEILSMKNDYDNGYRDGTTYSSNLYEGQISRLKEEVEWLTIKKQTIFDILSNVAKRRMDRIIELKAENERLRGRG